MGTFKSNALFCLPCAVIVMNVPWTVRMQFVENCLTLIVLLSSTFKVHVDIEALEAD